VSVADTTASPFAAITLKDDIAVSVPPASQSLPAGTAQVFTATVTGSGSRATGVAWGVNSVAGGNDTVGAILASSDVATQQRA